MNKIPFIAITSFLIVLLDLGLVVSNFGHFYLSILVPIVFLVTIYYDLELAFIFALLSGFFFDLSLLNRSLFMTIFLCLEVLAIDLMRKKIVDFVNPFIFIISIFILEIIRAILSIIIFPSGFSAFDALMIVIANLFFALFFMFLWWTFGLRKVRRI